MSTPRPETPYAETEMLLAVMNEDRERVQQLIASSTRRELVELSDHLDTLQDAIGEALR